MISTKISIWFTLFVRNCGFTIISSLAKTTHPSTCAQRVRRLLDLDRFDLTVELPQLVLLCQGSGVWVVKVRWSKNPETKWFIRFAPLWFFSVSLSQLGLNKSLKSWNLNGCPCFFLVGIHPKIAIRLVLDCWCSNFHQSSKLPRTQRLRPWRSIDTSSKFAAKPLSTTRCFGGFLGDKFETSILDDVFS